MTLFFTSSGLLWATVSYCELFYVLDAAIFSCFLSKQMYKLTVSMETTKMLAKPSTLCKNVFVKGNFDCTMI